MKDMLLSTYGGNLVVSVSGFMFLLSDCKTNYNETQEYFPETSRGKLEFFFNESYLTVCDFHKGTVLYYGTCAKGAVVTLYPME